MAPNLRLHAELRAHRRTFFGCMVRVSPASGVTAGAETTRRFGSRLTSTWPMSSALTERPRSVKRVPPTGHRVGLVRYRAVDVDRQLRSPSGRTFWVDGRVPPLLVDILGERARRIAVGPYTTATVVNKFPAAWTTRDNLLLAYDSS